MVITEMVSSADDIARGVLSGGGLAAGLVAISSKNLKPKDSSFYKNQHGCTRNFRRIY